MTVLAVVGAAVVIGLFDIAPVRSQLPVLEAAETSAAVPTDDAWASVWDDAPSIRVVLSAQELNFPFGGGTVDAVTVRSVFDTERLYLSLEWPDTAVNDTVNGVEDYSDAAAVQFPSDPGTSPPYTMGSASLPVNIWQWKALWETDIEQGFTTSADRYPNTFVDDYPNAGDSLYNPAAHVGNPLAQRSRSTPIENLVARGFGTLTNVDVQDVAGSGGWREGRWRVVFSRQMAPAADGLVPFAVNETTLVAFAVWDGASGDRNGQKSVAQFIELDVGPVDRPLAVGASEKDIPWVLMALIFGMIAPILAMALIAVRRNPAV